MTVETKSHERAHLLSGWSLMPLIFSAISISRFENACSPILERSCAGTKTIISHSAIAHMPNIRHVAVCFRHASNIEAISLARIALVLTRNPKSSITAGNSTVEQR